MHSSKCTTSWSTSFESAIAASHMKNIGTIVGVPTTERNGDGTVRMKTSATKCATIRTATIANEISGRASASNVVKWTLLWMSARLDLAAICASLNVGASLQVCSEFASLLRVCKFAPSLQVWETNVGRTGRNEHDLDALLEEVRTGCALEEGVEGRRKRVASNGRTYVLRRT